MAAPNDDSDVDSRTLSGLQKLALWVVIVVWIASWVLIWLESRGEGPGFPHWATVGFALGLISLLTFWAFFIARKNLDISMRTAIAATFTTFYIALVSYVVAVPGLITLIVGDAKNATTAGTAFSSVTTFMGVILAFYFTAAAAEKVATTAKEAAVQRATIQAESAERIAGVERTAGVAAPPAAPTSR